MNNYKRFLIHLTILLLLLPAVSVAIVPFDSDHSNVSYTQSQIDSLVSVEVHRQIDTQLIGLKIDKAASDKLGKYIEEENNHLADHAKNQARHDYFIGTLFTLLVAIVGIVIPLILNREREIKIKKLEEKLNKISSSAKEVEFSILLTRALSNEDADVRITALSNIIKEHKDNRFVSYAYNCRGCEYDDKGDTKKAIADYTKAIKIKPDFVEAYNNRGSSFDNSGKHDRALDDYTKAIELSPDYAVAYSNRSDVFYNKEMYKEALSDIKKAIKYNPYSDKAYGKYANMLMSQGKNKDALQKVDNAIKLNRDESRWYYLRSAILNNLKQYKEALEDAKKSIKIARRKGQDDLIVIFEEHINYINVCKQIFDNNSEKNNDSAERMGKDPADSNDTKRVHEDDMKKILAILREYYKDRDRGFPF